MGAVEVRRRRPPAFSDLLDLGEFFSYVFGFWLFLLVPRFRAAVVERWRSRHGLGHVATVWEMVISTGCAAILLWALWPSTFYFPA